MSAFRTKFLGLATAAVMAAGVGADAVALDGSLDRFVFGPNRSSADVERLLAAVAAYAPDAVAVDGPAVRARCAGDVRCAAAAVILSGRTGERTLAIPPPPVAPARGSLTVLVGPRTASSAKVLAALLRRQAGAAIAGRRTAGKDHLTRVVPVDNDWRLMLRAEAIRIPGETIRGSVRPDGPIPRGWEDAADGP